MLFFSHEDESLCCLTDLNTPDGVMVEHAAIVFLQAGNVSAASHSSAAQLINF